MTRWLAILIALSLGASALRADQFYDDRPHISTVRPSAEDRVVSDTLLRSLLDFVIELRVFYGQRVRFHLGRDGEIVYEMDWLLWSLLDEKRGPEPVLANVSRKSGASPKLWDYLKGRGVNGSEIVADTGYEGSVVDAMNGVLREVIGERVSAHLISSVHKKSPSSRVSTQAYLSTEKRAATLGRDDKEWFLDLVDQQITDVEDAPHFTATATEFRKNPRTRTLDAYSPEDAPAEEREAAERLQRQVAHFMRPDGEAVAHAKEVIGRLAPVFEALRTGGATQAEIEEAYRYTVDKRMDLIWSDLREAFAKGTFRAPPETMERVWRSIPGGAPLLFDLEPDQEERVLRKESERGVRSVSAKEPEKRKRGSGKKTPRDGGELSLIEEIMALHNQEREPEALRERGRALRQTREQLSRGKIHLEGTDHYVGERIDEGVRGEVFSLEGDRVIKIPFEADDVRYILVEIWVSEFLTRHFDKYQIRVLPILAVGEGGTFIVRNRLKRETLGQVIAEGKLSGAQMKALERLFERSKQLAEDTGVGLDIKYDNLAWIDGDWVLFDVGPRTSFGPYAFTLDIPSFEEFYRLWKVDERRPNGMTVDEFIERWHSEGCGGRIAKKA